MMDTNDSAAYEDILNLNLSEIQNGQILESPGCLLYTFIMYSVIMGTMCILGLIGNAVAFLVFWKDKLKTSTSFLFQGLSFVDMVMLVIAIPVYTIPPFVQYTSLFSSFQLIEPYFLVYVLPLAFISQTATIWLTVLVCVNRYIAVCKPYQASRLCTVNQARKQLALVLICAVIYNVPKYAEGHIEYTETDGIHYPYPAPTSLGKNHLYNIIYQNICYTAFMLIIPLLTLTLLNIRLISALKEIHKRRAEMQSMRQQQDNNVTFVLIIVVLVFTICQAPALVTQICWTVLPETARRCGGFQYYYSRVSNLLVILNSSVNFLIYFLFNQRFRQVLLENMCGCQTLDRGSVAYSNVNHAINNPNTTITQADANNHTTILAKDVVDKNGEGTNETLL